MANIRIGADWNRDGVIYWGENSTLDMISVVAVNVNGTSLEGTASGAPGTVTGLSGTFTDSGFSLSWSAPSGSPDYYIVFYEDFVSGTAASTSYSKTYSDLDLAEDITPYVMGAQWTIGCNSPNEVFMVEGVLSVDLDNSTRVFSPENTSSVLNDEDIINVRVKVAAEDSGGNWITQWVGAVANLSPDTTNRKQKATLTASQGLEALRKAPQPEGYLENVYAGEAVAFMLKYFIPKGSVGWRLGTDRLGISTFLYDGTNNTYDTGSFQYPVINETWITEIEKDDAIKGSNTNTHRIIENFTILEEGLFWISEEGFIQFKTKEGLINSAIGAGNLSVDSSAVDATYQYGTDAGLFNSITANYYPKGVYTGTVYSWTGEREIEALGSASIAVPDTTTSDSKVTPISISGVAVTCSTASYTTTYEINPNRTGLTVHVVDTAGTDGTITQITVSGTYLQSFDGIKVQEIDVDSIALYEERAQGYDIRETPTELIATNFAKRQLARFSRPRGRISAVRVVDKNAAWLDLILETKVGDSKYITEYQTGVSNKLSLVHGKKMRWLPGLLECEFVFNDHIGTSFWLLGVSTLGNNTILG